MSEELKPCPFCGGIDLEVHGKPGILNAHDDVGCNTCSAFTPFPTWNTRAELSRVKAGQGEAVEVVAHIYQHEETGIVGFVDQQQVDWGFQKNNPRLQLCGPLMTVAQHERIVAATTSPPSDPITVPVWRELLERIDQYYRDGMSINPELEELRALLAQSEEVKP